MLNRFYLSYIPEDGKVVTKHVRLHKYLLLINKFEVFLYSKGFMMFNLLLLN
jgi:hypothetical protein